jgi:flagellar basal-body rod protein FlgB
VGTPLAGEIGMKIFDATMGTLERALDVRLSRQTVLAGNLANANTPGFVQRDLDFAAAMAAAAAPAVPEPASAARPGDLPVAGLAPRSGAPEQFVFEQVGSSPGLDGNAVDIDRASAAVAENSLQYGATAKAMAKKLAILRYAASDGQA